MIRSMTAFSRAVLSSRKGAWTVEIRSLNHRYFEFSVKMPQPFAVLESRVRDLVQSGMRRGKVTVSISQERLEDKREMKIDDEAVRFHLETLGKLKKKFKLAGEISLEQVLKLPGIFAAPDEAPDPESVWPEIKKAVLKALEQADHSKQQEGDRLARDIEKRLTLVAEAVGKIQKYAASRGDAVFSRLQAKVEALLGEKMKDLERVEREVAFLAERSDITEELVRIKSHIDLFRKKLKQDMEVGRELDFICQEMNREANTMGSKSQFFEISTEVVFVKGELEKIREQIQNIE